MVGLAVFGGAALAQVGCGEEPATGEAAKGRVVLVAVDQSCDASAQLAASAEAAIKTSVRAAAADQGTFLAQPVTTAVYQTVDFAAAKDFVTTKQNEHGRRRDLENQATDYLDESATKALWAGHTDQACGSDLINALKAANRAVGNQAKFQGRPLDIVYVTNGIVINRLANFRHADLDSAGTTRLLKEVKAQGFIPDLGGARVYFVGVGLDANLDAVQTQRIEQFWLRFAREANAKAVVVPAGTQLALSEPEPSK